MPVACRTVGRKYVNHTYRKEMEAQPRSITRLPRAAPAGFKWCMAVFLSSWQPGCSLPRWLTTSQGRMLGNGNPRLRGGFEKCGGSFVDGRLRVIDNPDDKQGQELASGLATSSYRAFSLPLLENCRKLDVSCTSTLTSTCHRRRRHDRPCAR